MRDSIRVMKHKGGAFASMALVFVCFLGLGVVCRSLQLVVSCQVYRKTEDDCFGK